MLVYERLVDYKPKETHGNDIILTKPDTVFDYLRGKFNPEREEVFVLALNAKKNLIAEKLFSGTISSSTVHPRDVFSFLFDSLAESFLIAHNHPTGSLEISSEDIQLTKELSNGGKMMGMQLVDHIVFTSTDYVSMRKDNIL